MQATKSKTTYRKRSDREKAMALLALKANGGNVNRTARETGVPRKTLEKWAAGQAVNSDVAEIGQQKEPELIDELRRLAASAVSSAFTKLEAATFAQTMTGAGIAIDKAQLLSGKPTQIVDEASRVEAAVAYVMQKTKCDRGVALEALAAQMPEVKELGRIG